MNLRKLSKLVGPRLIPLEHANLLEANLKLDIAYSLINDIDSESVTEYRTPSCDIGDKFAAEGMLKGLAQQIKIFHRVTTTKLSRLHI